MLYENTYSGEHAAANAKMACVKDKESDHPLLDSVSTCRPMETESDGATSAIDRDPGIMEVSTPPRDQTHTAFRIHATFAHRVPFNRIK